MNSWIDPEALWKIVVVGFLAGAGLPALFAIAVRALNPAAGAEGDGGVRATAGVGGYAVAAVCFAVVLAAIGWGILLIVRHS
ncbi:hypothetical protein ACIQOW_10210 [Kitasatospora sp. NPDC091335]|uniref:hypothetical protein n=1 Tax=Kitasatospora sp. NPDC091335 TaxID=3364085 RepID=UPI003824BC7F